MGGGGDGPPAPSNDANELAYNRHQFRYMLCLQSFRNRSEVVEIIIEGGCFFLSRELQHCLRSFNREVGIESCEVALLEGSGELDEGNLKQMWPILS